jgi:hypothetical protein
LQSKLAEGEDVKKRTITLLFVRAFVLAGLLRIAVVALDSLTDITDTVRASKDVIWIPGRQKVVGAPAAEVEALLSNSFILKAPQVAK